MAERASANKSHPSQLKSVSYIAISGVDFELTKHEIQGQLPTPPAGRSPYNPEPRAREVTGLLVPICGFALKVKSHQRGNLFSVSAQRNRMQWYTTDLSRCRLLGCLEYSHEGEFHYPRESADSLVNELLLLGAVWRRNRVAAIFRIYGISVSGVCGGVGGSVSQPKAASRILSAFRLNSSARPPLTLLLD